VLVQSPSLKILPVVVYKIETQSNYFHTNGVYLKNKIITMKIEFPIIVSSVIASIIVSITLSACGQNKKTSSNLIQVSEFSIVKAERDTIYLRDGNSFVPHLKSYWDNCNFNGTRHCVIPSVIILNQKDFDILSSKSIKDPDIIRGLTELTDCN